MSQCHRPGAKGRDTVANAERAGSPKRLRAGGRG